MSTYTHRHPPLLLPVNFDILPRISLVHLRRLLSVAPVALLLVRVLHHLRLLRRLLPVTAVALLLVGVLVVLLRTAVPSKSYHLTHLLLWLIRVTLRFVVKSGEP